MTSINPVLKRFFKGCACFIAVASNPLPALADTGKPFVLKPDEELDLTLKAEEANAHVRVSTDYVVIEMPQHHMVLVSKRPTWAVQAISPARKLTGTSTLEDFVRRGSPLNFLKVSAVPEWPLIAQGPKAFRGWQAIDYALPYKTQRGAVVPLSRGRVGDMVVLGEGIIPKPACEIFSTLMQLPKVNGIPVKLDLWDFDKSPTKINSVFIFSGGKKSDSKDVETFSAAILKRRSLPSAQGYKVCKDTRDVWVSNADTQGFEGLMR